MYLSNLASRQGDEKMARQMTSQERMTALFRGEKPDRVPVNPFVLGYCAKITGVSIGDLYADGDKMFDAQMAARRLHGYDATPGYGYASFGPWEFGGRIEMPYKEGSSAPYVLEHMVNRIEDIEKLEVPDFRKNIPGSYAESYKIARRCRELGMRPTFKAGSTFSAAANVANTSLFLKWLHREPKAVHLLMEKVSALFINALEFFAGTFGPENCMPYDGGPTESNTVISPQRFKEFAYPYQEKVHTRIKELGFPGVSMHPCADQNGNIPYYVQLREKLNWSGKYLWLLGPKLH